MSKESNQPDWLHVIVCSRDEQEYYMGLHDNNSGVDFVPVFESREDADSCLQSFGKNPGIGYHVTAVLTAEIVKQCSDRNYLIALVDQNGAIIRQFFGEEIDVT